MKAWEILIFLFALNAMIGVMAYAAPWGGTALRQQVTMSISEWVAVGGATAIALSAGLEVASSGLRPPVVIATGIFGGIFWSLYYNTYKVLNVVFQGEGAIIIGVLTAFNILAFVAAISQIASQTSWRGME